MRWWEEWLRPRTIGVIALLALFLLAPGFLTELLGRLLYVAILVGLILYVLLGRIPGRKKGK